MQLRETSEWQFLETGDVFPVALGEQRQNIIAVIIPGAKRQACVLRSNNAKFRKWRIAGETFVGTYLNICRVVDGQQAYLIEVDRFLHRLHESETQQTIF